MYSQNGIEKRSKNKIQTIFSFLDLVFPTAFHQNSVETTPQHQSLDRNSAYHNEYSIKYFYKKFDLMNDSKFQDKIIAFTNALVQEDVTSNVWLFL